MYWLSCMQSYLNDKSHALVLNMLARSTRHGNTCRNGRQAVRQIASRCKALVHVESGSAVVQALGAYVGEVAVSSYKNAGAHRWAAILEMQHHSILPLGIVSHLEVQAPPSGKAMLFKARTSYHAPYAAFEFTAQSFPDVHKDLQAVAMVSATRPGRFWLHCLHTDLMPEKRVVRMVGLLYGIGV